MEIRPRLLEHPFYQAWTKGELSVEQLVRYHQGYARFIERFPSYWRTVVDAFSPDAAGDAVVRDELDHIELWKLWGSALPSAVDAPGLEKTIAAFDAMPPSRLLGAIHAFELQQPEVAATKKDGLLRHYGFRPDALTYFDEHLHEEKHIAYGLGLAERFADPAEFSEGVRSGAEFVYASLDDFVR
jgi:pyrroloquinoline-quinone synthase